MIFITLTRDCKEQEFLFNASRITQILPHPAGGCWVDSDDCMVHVNQTPAEVHARIARELERWMQAFSTQWTTDLVASLELLAAKEN